MFDIKKQPVKYYLAVDLHVRSVKKNVDKFCILSGATIETIWSVSF